MKVFLVILMQALWLSTETADAISAVATTDATALSNALPGDKWGADPECVARGT